MAAWLNPGSINTQSWADKLATAADADALAECFAALLKAEGIEAGVACGQHPRLLCMPYGNSADRCSRLQQACQQTCSPNSCVGTETA